MAGMKRYSSVSKSASPHSLPLRFQRKVLQEMERCHIMHPSNDGYFDQAAPLLTYMILVDDFRVNDLPRVRTKALLVVFSAGLSRNGTTYKGDDVLGFSHAMLAANASAFQGAPWSAEEAMTMLLLMLSYTQILHYKEPAPWRGSGT